MRTTLPPTRPLTALNRLRSEVSPLPPRVCLEAIALATAMVEHPLPDRPVVKG